VDLLVGPFAIQASGPVNANTMPVLEAHDLARRGLSGLLIRKLVYDRGDPAMLLHGGVLIVEFFLRATDEFSQDCET
jgi:hypothetical protein